MTSHVVKPIYVKNMSVLIIHSSSTAPKYTSKYNPNPSWKFNYYYIKRPYKSQG